LLCVIIIQYWEKVHLLIVYYKDFKLQKSMMSILKTLFGSQFVSMYALFFLKIKKFIFNWINVDIFVTCIIFQSFIFEYLELDLLMVLVPSCFMKLIIRLMKFNFLCNFWILMLIIMIDYMVLSIQYQLIVNTSFVPFIKFLNFFTHEFLLYINNFKIKYFCCIFKKNSRILL
jgi:hypothetical protein